MRIKLCCFELFAKNSKLGGDLISFFRRQYLKYFVHVALQCQPLFFSSSAPLWLPGEGGVGGGGDDDVQAASNSCEAQPIGANLLLSA